VRAIGPSLSSLFPDALADPTLELRNSSGSLIIINDNWRTDQKQEIIERLTDAMVSIEGENMRHVTWCVVEEVKSGDWGIAGNSLTTEQVHALASGAV